MLKSYLTLDFCEISKSPLRLIDVHRDINKIKSYNANKRISAASIRCKIYSYQVGYANFMNFKPFWGCSGFFVLEKRSSTYIAPSFGPHTFFIRSKQSEESVWTKAGARARARSGGARCTYYEKRPEKL